MIPAEFDYVAPESLEEALAALREGGEDAKVLAGGHSLLPLMKLRLAAPTLLVDLRRVPGLSDISRENGTTRLGAMTTHHQVATADLGVASAAAATIADQQVRNRGTIGGGIAHADPASDMPALLLALDADVIVRSTKGERTIPITKFFKGPFTTALNADEILVEIRFLSGRDDYGSAYRTIEQPASGYSLAGAAVIVGRTGGGKGPFDDVRIALAGVADTPYRATAAEKAFLASARPADAAAHATDGVTVASDIHADATFRAAVAAVQVRRALEAAIVRAE